jgi:hypothetical protein
MRDLRFGFGVRNADDEGHQLTTEQKPIESGFGLQTTAEEAGGRGLQLRPTDGCTSDLRTRHRAERRR